MSRRKKGLYRVCVICMLCWCSLLLIAAMMEYSLRDDFIPSDFGFNVSAVLSAILCLFYIMAMVGAIVSGPYAPKPFGKKRWTGLFLTVPMVFIYFLWQLPFVMYVAHDSSASRVTVVELFDASTTSSRNCSNVIIRSDSINDIFLRSRRLCGLSTRNYRLIGRQTPVALTGTSSKWGIKVTSIKVVGI